MGPHKIEGGTDRMWLEPSTYTAIKLQNAVKKLKEYDEDRHTGDKEYMI